MEHDFIDKYSRTGSVLSRLDPRIKVVSLLAFTVCLVSTDPTSHRAFAVYGLVLAVLTALSGIPFPDLTKRMLVALPFILMTVLFLPFMKEGSVVHVFHLGPLSITVTREGVILFWNVLAKASLALLCAILLTATTSFPELLKALEKLKCPRVLIMILSFMYRYIFVVQDEFMIMRQARDARSAGGGRWLHVKALASMIGVLFIRSYERAESVYLAMCSRGFHGRICTIQEFRLATRDAVFLVLMLASLISARLL
jgi:cobalt/nickel transport system permease protein